MFEHASKPELALADGDIKIALHSAHTHETLGIIENFEFIAGRSSLRLKCPYTVKELLIAECRCIGPLVE
jgi:hypothetical protein